MMVRLALTLTGLFVLLMMLIRAQPYDNPALRQLLTPATGCQAPCFMGLRPGVTTQAEAIERFEQAAGISYRVLNQRDETAILYWRDATSPYSGSVFFQAGRVAGIVFEGFRLYEVWLTLGEPDGKPVTTYEMIRVGGQQALFQLPFSQVEYYTDHNLSVEVAASCVRFWQQLASITLVPKPILAATHPRPLADRRRDICERQRVYQRLSQR